MGRTRSAHVEDGGARIKRLERELQRQMQLTEQERRRADLLEARVRSAYELVAWGSKRA